MTHRETDKATLEIEIDDKERVKEIFFGLMPDKDLTSIKWMRNNINKYMIENAIDLTHLDLTENTLNTVKINGMMPIIQDYNGTISHYSITQQSSESYETVMKNTKAVNNQTKRYVCPKCDIVGCFVRRHNLDNGTMGFKKDTRGGLCGQTVTLDEALSIKNTDVWFDNSNLPAFNHKITMIEISFINEAWAITPVYRQPNKQLFQYTGMKGVSAVANEKQIAPMYRRNVSINGKGKQIYHQCAVGFFGDFYALVMINHNNTDDAKVTFEYPPLGVINRIGIKGGEQ